MKTYNIILVAIMAIFLMSCKSGDTIAPKDSKIQGALGEYFEVVAKDYKVKDGKISIEIKRIKEGLPAPWAPGMELGDGDGEYEPSFMIEFLDEDDNVVSKSKSNIVLNEEDLRTLIGLGVNESSTIQFSCIDKSDSFKVSSTFEVHGASAEACVEKTLTLEGSLVSRKSYPIVMTMHIAANGEVKGAYYYKSKGPRNYLSFVGQLSDGHMKFYEFTKEGNQTGTFEGTFENDTFSGLFKTKSGNYQFVLKPSDAAAVDFSGIDFSMFYPIDIDYDVAEESSSYESSSSGSDDWDAWLDSYEQYVNKLVSCAQKAAKGDPRALTEYASLLQNAQELQEKLASAEGELSSSQLARYNRINQKMLTATQNM